MRNAYRTERIRQAIAYIAANPIYNDFHLHKQPSISATDSSYSLESAFLGTVNVRLLARRYYLQLKRKIGGFGKVGKDS